MPTRVTHGGKNVSKKGEDKHGVDLGDTTSVYAVFDGHGGAQAVAHAPEKIGTSRNSCAATEKKRFNLQFCNPKKLAFTKSYVEIPNFRLRLLLLLL